MTRQVKKLMQNMIDGEYSLVKIPLTIIKDFELVHEPELLDIFNHAYPIGISPGYNTRDYLVALAVSDDKRCCIIEFPPPLFDRKKNVRKPLASESVGGRVILQERILCRPAGDIYAFDMAPLSMSLNSIGLRIVNGVDIQTAFPDSDDRKPLTVIRDAVGGTVRIIEENISDVFRNPVYDETDRNRFTDLAMRAWVSQFLPGYGNGEVTFADVKKIDTLKLTPEMISMMSKVAGDRVRADLIKPVERIHHRISAHVSGDGRVALDSPSFNNRFRGGQEINMTINGKNGEFIQRGKIDGTAGRAGTLLTERNFSNTTTVDVKVKGRDDSTPAEVRRDKNILNILQGDTELLKDLPWIRNVWFPSADGSLVWPKEWSTASPALSLPSKYPPAIGDNLARLNGSQQRAVNSMISMDDSHRIVSIQGPPGTGKTSVIAAYIQMADLMGYKGIWLVAKSNVAVKNIAEKLLSVQFTSWKLIVSNDFKADWHEHLYESISEYVISSRPRDLQSAASQLRGCSVMLCTLDMLSNNSVAKFIFPKIPLNTLIIDEASQIEIGSYLPIFHDMKILHKVCFIGDPQQLAPYGQEEIPDLKSIFEVEHLSKDRLLLETQYRMPPQLGRFISEAVYENKLKSNPKHPIKDAMVAVYFIDAPGQEMKTISGSYVNDGEKLVAIQLAQHLQNLGKKYKIISPYDGQTNNIQTEMQKTEGLEWGDKCFNVDSFQGNEEDYIIISLVRSRELGFLSNVRRTNVMLTRCKKGMFIITSQKFIIGEGADSLVGHLVDHVSMDALVNAKDVEKGYFLQDLEKKTLKMKA